MRRVAAAVGGLAIAGGLLLVAEPVYACSCMAPKVAAELRAGNVVAIVNRVYTGAADSVTLQVKATAGGAVPAEITIPYNSQCSPQILVDGLTALALSPRSFEFASCGPLDLGLALERAQGAPKVSGEGPAAAIAAGRYGGSRLVALDRTGHPLAWDGRSGAGTAVAPCPGGRTVVATGETGERYAQGRAEVSVHDATTLQPRRVVRLGSSRDPAEILALRCADPAGGRVELIQRRYGNSDNHTYLISIEGRRVRTQQISDVTAAATAGEGFLVAGSGDGATLARLDAAGARTVVTELTGSALGLLVVSPDGATAAMQTGEGPGSLEVRTVDLATGAELARWGTPGGRQVTGLAWAADGTLLARISDGSAEARPARLTFDRELREIARGVTGPGWKFSAVGSDAVTFDDAPMRVSRGGGQLASLPELRLAATADVLSLTPAGFDIAELKAEAPAAPTSLSGDGVPIWPFAAFAGVAALGLALLLGRRLMTGRQEA